MPRLAWPWSGHRPPDLVIGDGSLGSWAGLTGTDLTELLLMFVPLRRLLLLAGYDVPSLYARAAPGLDWVAIDLYAPQARQALPGEAGPDGDPSGDGAVSARLVLIPFRSSADPGGAGAALDLPVAGLGLPVQLLPSVPDPSVTFLDITVPDDTGIDDLIFPVETLTTEWLGHAVGAVPGASLEPGGGAGLLWLVDPDTWWADLTAARQSPQVRELEEVAAIARDVVRDTLGTEDNPLGAFLTEQVTNVATERPAPPLPFLAARRGAPTLKRLLRWADPGSAKAGRRSASFFENVRTWVEDRALTSVLPEDDIDVLAESPWFEVIATLIDRGIITPPALLGGSGAASGTAAESPVEAVRVDSHAVDLVVLGQLTVSLRVTRDATGAEVGPDEADDSSGPWAPIREFTWDFLSPQGETEASTLVLVAAPGVEVSMPSSPAPVGWKPLVIRVPDVSVVPEWGAGVRPQELLAPYAVGPDEGGEIELPGQPPAAPATQVTPKPDGVTLVYPAPTDPSAAVLVSVDITLGPGALMSGDERFCWHVVYYHDDRGSPLPEPTAHIVVWATRGVTVSVVTSALTELRDFRLETEVWRVGDYADIPALGTPLPFDTGTMAHFAGWPDTFPPFQPPWTADEAASVALRFERDRSVETSAVATTWWFTMLVDMIVGEIPLVGDVTDIADFFYALSSGTNKWGQPVTRLDLVFMGGAALMPFVSGSLAEGMGKVIEGLPAVHAPLRAVPAAAPTRGIGFDDLIHRALTPEGLTVADAADAASEAARWNGLDAAGREVVATRLRAFAQQFAKELGEQVASRFLVLDDLLDGARKNFRFWYLRMELEDWRAVRQFNWDGTPPLPDLSIEAFLENPPSRRVRALLQVLLGDDIIGSAVQRARRPAWANVAAPSLARIVPRRSPPSRAWLEDFVAGAVPDAPSVDALVEEALEYRKSVWSGPAPIHWDQQYMQMPDIGAWPPTGQYAQRCRLLLGRGLTALIGADRSFHPDELVEMLVTSQDVVAHELRRVGLTLDDVLPAAGDPRLLGVENVVNGLVSTKLPEHSARHELRLAASELAAAPQAARARLGVKLPGVTDLELRDGPDALLYPSSLIADLLQGKSFASLVPLAATEQVAGWFRGGAWRGPEVFRQTVSDLIRMANQPVRCRLPGLTEAEDALFSGRFVIHIDREYFLASPVANLSPLDFITARGLDPEAVLRWPTTRLTQEFEPTELCLILDHIKTRFDRPSADRIDDLAESITEGLADQLTEFLNPVATPPDTPRGILNGILGVIIPDEIELSVEVKFQ